MTKSLESLIVEMKSAAEKATEGRWGLVLGDEGNFDAEDGLINREEVGFIPIARIEGAAPYSGFDVDFQLEQQANAEFIHQAQPENVLTLIAALEQAQKQSESWERLAKQNIAEREKDIEALTLARQRIAELESCGRIEYTRRLERRVSELEVSRLSMAVNDVIAERERQIDAEGYATQQDDKYRNSELSDAAACYALYAHNQGFSAPEYWPWDEAWWKQTDPRRDLIKAGALIIAEIERLDRSNGGTVHGGE